MDEQSAAICRFRGCDECPPSRSKESKNKQRERRTPCVRRGGRPRVRMGGPRTACGQTARPRPSVGCPADGAVGGRRGLSDDPHNTPLGCGGSGGAKRSQRQADRGSMVGAAVRANRCAAAARLECGNGGLGAVAVVRREHEGRRGLAHDDRQKRRRDVADVCGRRGVQERTHVLRGEEEKCRR